MGGHAVQHAAGRGQNANAEAVLHLGDLVSAHIHAATGGADALQAGDDGLALLVLQRDGNVAVVDSHVFDVTFLLEDGG